MTSISENDCSLDAFLGGRLSLWQPRKGYRAGVDPVLLAASVAAKPGQSLLDLGCGVGTAALCVGARVPGMSLLGVERERLYAALAVRNGLDVVQADLAELPHDLRQQQFDHVLTNPPYFDRDASVQGPDAAKEAARGEDVPLCTWIAIAAKRVRPKGYLHVVHRMSRLPDLLAGMGADMGSIAVLPLAAREGRAAERLILRARKGGKAPFHLAAPLILHEGSTHLKDAEDYAAPVKAMLRDGAALDF
ncbi:MAG: tRNA1(Val) (adenine(37)-N6)-methyltransferase [Sulfitobacter sp.]